MTMHTFVVMIFLSDDGDFAEYRICAQSALMAVCTALRTYHSKASYPILEIKVKRID